MYVKLRMTFQNKIRIEVKIDIEKKIEREGGGE